MSVRFEPAARRAIDAAMIDAETRGHATLDPAHLLLGLVVNPAAPAVAALDVLGISPEQLRAAASEALADLPALHPGTIDIDDATEGILSRASDYVGNEGRDAVSDLDILIASAELGGTRAARVLAGAGCDAERLRAVAQLVRETSAVRETLSSDTSEMAVPAKAPPLATRVGTGYDSHRFAEGGPMVLGGIRIPLDYHLAGHSDGDAIAHAITDALLGAASAGDIGEMFADTDPANAGRDSMEMLRAAVERVSDRGWRVGQVDATLIAERPKLLPHRAAMREALAAALGVDVDCVSVKGKTNEGMGWIGRGEGVACVAVATLVRRGAPAAPATD